MQPVLLLVPALLVLVALAELPPFRANAAGARRVVVALLLIFTAGVLVWGTGTASIPVGRSHLIVVGPDADRAEILTLLGTLDDSEPLAFLQLRDDVESEGEEGTPSRTADWRRVRELRSGGIEGVSSVIACSPAIDASREDWSLMLEEAIVSTFASRSVLPSLRRDTVTMVCDDGPLWRGLEAGDFSTTRMLNKLSLVDAELWVYEATASARTGTLNIVPGEPTFPAMNNVKGLLGARVYMEVAGLPSGVDAGDWQVDVTMMSPGDGCGVSSRQFRWSGEIQFREVEEQPGRFLGTFVLATLEPSASVSGATEYRVDAGMHLFDARVRIDHEGQQSYSCVRQTYLEFTDSGFVLIAPKASYELRSWLHGNGWASGARDGVAPPASIESLYNDFRRRPKFGQSNRTRDYDLQAFSVDGSVCAPGTEIDVGIARDQAAADSASNCDEAREMHDALDSSGSLVIVEPSLADLIYLDELLGLESRIRSGLNLLLVGPPVSGPEAPSFVPVFSKASDPADPESGPLRVLRDHRIAFVFDQSRSMRMLLGDDNRTPLEFQRMVANRILERLEISRQGPFVLSGGRLDFPDKRGHRPDNYDLPGADGARFEHFATVALVLAENRKLDDDFGAGQYTLGYGRDVAPGNIEARLSALFGANVSERVIRPADALRSDAWMPNTHVVLFVSDLPQQRSGVRALAEPGEGKLPLPLKRHYAARLAVRGVRLHVVTVPRALPGHRVAIERHMAGVALDEALEIPAYMSPAYVGFFDPESNVIRYPGDLRNPASTADAILGTIEAHESGSIDLLNPARTTDTRAESGVLPPSAHTLLGGEVYVAPNEGVAPSNAAIDGAGPNGKNAALPLIRSAYFGEGLVVCCAYSPFARDMWDTDAGKLAWIGPNPELRPSTTDEIRGWGVQRLIDLEQLTGEVRPLGDAALIIKDASISQDGSTLHLVCWFQDSIDPKTDSLRFPSPKLLIGDQEIAFQRRGINVARSTTVFKLIAEDEPLQGGACISTGGASGSEVPIVVSLEPADVAGSDIVKGLETIAGFSGGGVTDRVRIGDRGGFRLPSAWLAVILLTSCAIALFSPAARPWTAFGLFVRRRRARGAVKRTRRPRLDASSFVVDWGPRLYKTTSGRVAGEPGGIKQYEPGDRISSSVPATLFPFTSMREATGLPQQRPTIKLTYITQATSVHIVLDNTRGLNQPPGILRPGKGEFARFIAAVIALVSWKQGGTVTVSATGSEDLVFGPSSSSGDLDELEAILVEAIEVSPVKPSSASLRVPDGIASGGILFLVSDLLSHEADEVESFAKAAVERGFRLRVVHLLDKTEYQLIGFVSVPGMHRRFDRTSMTPETLAALYGERRVQYEAACTAFGGRYLRLDVSRDAGDLVEALLSASFLNPGGGES